MRLALGLAYDGTSFSGWQTQPTGDAVQDALERSLSALAGHRVDTICAGRTDAGVHALQQIVHFETAAQRPLNAWVRGTNARLPATVAVQWAQEVSPDFHARFSARSRTYRYLIRCAPVAHPLWRDRAGWVFRPLSIEPMREAAAHLIGEHDFSAFRSSQCQAASPVRTVSALTLSRRGDFIALTITANAFLHHMVRNIAGLLIAVGRGARVPGDVDRILASRDRRQNSATAPAEGLCLMSVVYPGAFGLPGDPL